MAPLTKGLMEEDTRTIRQGVKDLFGKKERRKRAIEEHICFSDTSVGPGTCIDSCSHDRNRRRRWQIKPARRLACNVGTTRNRFWSRGAAEMVFCRARPFMWMTYISGVASGDEQRASRNRTVKSEKGWIRLTFRGSAARTITSNSVLFGGLFSHQLY